MANSTMQTQMTNNSAGGSRTLEARPQPVLRLSLPSGTLRLRAEPPEERHIQWAEDVIDNEGMGKKSSKVCCIYHKPRAMDESSDESSSDSSDSNSDSEPDNSRARPVGGSRRGRRPQDRRHDHDSHDHNHDPVQGGSSDHAPRKSHARPRKRSPNAYEKMPKKR